MADAVGPRPARLALRMRRRWRTTYLGAEFDIHCGGMDLVFPHHENEIAQADAAGDGFARYWLHNGWVTMGGEKMSKSLGNVLAIPAVLQRVRPAELRYYLGSAHYRSMLEFSETALQDAAKAYTGIEDFLHRVRTRVGAVVPGDVDRRSSPPRSTTISRCRSRWPRCTPRAPRATGRSRPATTTPRWRRRASIRAMMGILGCDPLDERWETRDETVRRAGRRRRAGACGARSAATRPAQTRDWAQADEIRDRLKEAGIEVTDTADGPQWSLLRRRTAAT